MNQNNILPTFLDFRRVHPTKHLETLLIQTDDKGLDQHKIE